MPTALFIHGAWVTPACWSLFRRRFEAAGYRCDAPAWPYFDRPLEELRRDPPDEIGSLGVDDIVRHYVEAAQRIRHETGERPVIVGHSFGGLFTQILIDQGHGSAGVAIDSAPPRGVFPRGDALRANLPVFLQWRAWNRAVRMKFEHFAWGFANGLPREEQRRIFAEHVVPAPGRLFVEAALAPVHRKTFVDFRRRDRAPLLLVGADRDRTIPLSMVFANYQRYMQSPSVTELKVFRGRSHWLIAEGGWEEVADAALSFFGKSRKARVGTQHGHLLG